MKCKLDIRKGIINKAINSNIRDTIKKINEKTLFMLHSDYSGNSYSAAKNVVKSINKTWDSELAFTDKKTNGTEIRIEPNSKLVDEYYEVYTQEYNTLNTIQTGIDQFGDSNTNLQELYNNAMDLTPQEVEERIKKCE